MEFHGETNTDLWTFMDEERKTINLPRRLSFPTAHNHHHRRHSSPEHHGGATSRPSSPPENTTPWTLSPVRTSPTQPLLYHCIASLHRHVGNISSVALSGDLIFTGSDSNRVHAWKRPDCAEIGHVIKANSGQVRAMIVADSRRTLFTAHGDLKVRAYDVSSYGERSTNFKPKKIATLPAHRSPIMTSLSSFSRSKNARQQQHKDQISCMAYNHDDKLLYTGSWDRTVKAWKVNEKRCVDSFVAHEGHVNAIVVNQEDGCVFTCSSDGSVKIWRRVFGESSHILTMTLKFQLSPVNALALSSPESPPESSSNHCNTSLLYSGSSDGIINFWEKEKTSGRYNHGGFIQGHHFSVLCLVAIGELVFSGSEDSTVRVWRRSEEGNWFHSCIAVVEGHRGPVRCLAVSVEERDERSVKGLLVYSASLDQSFKVWRVKVFPSSEKVIGFEETLTDQNSEIIRDDVISPVLSPSWVEKKLQGIHF